MRTSSVGYRHLVGEAVFIQNLLCKREWKTMGTLDGEKVDGRQMEE